MDHLNIIHEVKILQEEEERQGGDRWRQERMQTEGDVEVEGSREYVSVGR